MSYLRYNKSENTEMLKNKEFRKGEKMIEKIKALPEKVAFGIGFTLILSSPILLYLLSLLFSFGNWTTMLVQGIAYGVAVIFILSAADKRHSRFDKKK